MPRRSGRLNVVALSPSPQCVPIAAKRAAFWVRLTEEPSQSSQPAGISAPPYEMIVPGGTEPGRPGGGAGVAVFFSSSTMRLLSDANAPFIFADESVSPAANVG